MNHPPIIRLERNNANRVFIGVTEFNQSTAMAVRSYVLSHQCDGIAASVMERRFEDLKNLIGKDRAVFLKDLSPYESVGDALREREGR